MTAPIVRDVRTQGQRREADLPPRCTPDHPVSLSRVTVHELAGLMARMMEVEAETGREPTVMVAGAESLLRPVIAEREAEGVDVRMGRRWAS